MIGLGAKYLTAAGFGRYRITAASLGSNLMFWDWLLYATKQTIMDAFGVDGTAVIAATNEYLNGIAQTQGRQAAQAMADYINAYPLAGVYNQDGLVFQMDCDYECSAETWKDIKGDRNFVGTNVQISDGVPTFDGTAWYRYATNLVYPHTSSTIEVVVKMTGYTNSWGCVFFMGDTSGIVFAANSVAVYNIGNKGIRDFTSGTLQVIGMNDNVRCKNGAVDTTIANNNITKQQAADTRIGARSDGNSCFKGKIYAIRIYNRLLTEAEILANQEIDLKRWTQPTP